MQDPDKRIHSSPPPTRDEPSEPGDAAAPADADDLGHSAEHPAAPEPAERAGTLEEVIEEVESSLHRFIRHQYNWFALDDPTIQWFDVTQATFEEIEAVVRDWLETC